MEGRHVRPHHLHRLHADRHADRCVARFGNDCLHHYARFRFHRAVHFHPDCLPSELRGFLSPRNILRHVRHDGGHHHVDRNDHRYAAGHGGRRHPCRRLLRRPHVARLDLCAPRQRPNGSRPLYEYKKYGKIRSPAIPHFLRDLLCSWRNASRCRRVSRSFCRL